MVALTRKQALTMLIGARFIIGTVSWFFPAVTTRVMLIDAKANPALPYALRLFGVRDVLMGMLILSSSGDALDQHLHTSAVIDLIDVAASGIAGFTGQMSKRAAIFCCGASLIGAGLGLASLGKGPLSRKTTCIV